jgi:hypothetical protein
MTEGVEDEAIKQVLIALASAIRQRPASDLPMRQPLLGVRGEAHLAGRQHQIHDLGRDMSRASTGHIRKLVSGRYQARFTYPDGVRRPAPTTFLTSSSGFTSDPP